MSLPRRSLLRARNPSIAYLCQAVGPAHESAVGVTEPSRLGGSSKRNRNSMSRPPQRPGQFNPLHPGTVATLYGQGYTARSRSCVLSLFIFSQQPPRFCSSLTLAPTSSVVVLIILFRVISLAYGIITAATGFEQISLSLLPKIHPSSPLPSAMSPLLLIRSALALVFRVQWPWSRLTELLH